MKNPNKDCHCGHPKSDHYNGTGMCEHEIGGYLGPCSCRKFKLPRVIPNPFKLPTLDYGNDRKKQQGK
jgi:hypothetical protein